MVMDRSSRGTKRLRNDFDNLKEDSSTDVDFSPSKREKPSPAPKKQKDTTASDLGPPTPGLPSVNRRPSSPSSTTRPKKPVNRNLIPEVTNEVEVTNNDTTSREAKLLKKLKKLSKMKPRVESCLEVTGSVNLLELFRSSDAWNKAGRGVMLLKEGLEMVTQAENILAM